MAYGKIKADSIVYDNSGSDVDTTIASLVAPKEGTAIISTGESGTTKFLRIDGDGTCSWQVPPNTQLTLIDEDNMASNDATKPPSQQSVKAYVDTKAPTANPTFTGTVNAAALTLSGNLQVNGTTTTVASSTMTVADKNIEIAKGAANDAAADGAGITVDSGDGDKTWNWVDATDAWTSSEHIHLGDSKQLKIGAGTDLKLWHNGTSSYINNVTGTLNITSADDGYIQFRGGVDQAEMLLQLQDNGAVEAYHNGSKKIETTAAGVTVTGTVTDDKGDVRKIPPNVQTGAYTLVASDAGKFIRAQAAITVPNSIFSDGDAVTIINNSGSNITITQGISLMYNSADGSTGNRTLAGRGMATVLFATANICFISGSGLS